MWSGATAEGIHLRHAEVAHPDRANFSGVVELEHRLSDLLDRHFGVRPMHLIEVDDIGPQTPQRIIDLLADARPAGIAEYLAVVPIQPDLGGDADPVSRFGFSQSLAHQLFCVAEAVGRCCVDQCDAAVDR